MNIPYKEIEKTYLNYEGPFSIQIISNFAKFLTENVIAEPKVIMKLHRIFIELTQNITLYSFEREYPSKGSSIGRGQVYLINKPDEFQCFTINMIQKEHAQILINNCNEINATPINDLRTKKNKLRKLAHIQDTGAHIGLIMICTYSESPIDFEMITTSNDELYLKIGATIHKKRNFKFLIEE